MSALQPSHAMWLRQGAVLLEGTSAEVPLDPSAAARAAVLRAVAAKVAAAVGGADGPVVLTIDEHAVLMGEAQALTQRAERELRRREHRDLARAEECLAIACALCEVAVAAPA